MTPSVLGQAAGWCHSQRFKTDEIGLVLEEGGKFTSKHVEFEMPAGSPRRVAHWAVEYPVPKRQSGLWAGEGELLQDSCEADEQEVLESAEKTVKKHPEMRKESGSPKNIVKRVNCH